MMTNEKSAPRMVDVYRPDGSTERGRVVAVWGQPLPNEDEFVLLPARCTRCVAAATGAPAIVSLDSGVMMFGRDGWELRRWGEPMPRRRARSLHAPKAIQVRPDLGDAREKIRALLEPFRAALEPWLGWEARDAAEAVLEAVRGRAKADERTGLRDEIRALIVSGWRWSHARVGAASEPPMLAMIGTPCAVCAKAFTDGDLIAPIPDGRPAHARCAPGTP